jgi:hypothetical protein
MRSTILTLPLALLLVLAVASPAFANIGEENSFLSHSLDLHKKLFKVGACTASKLQYLCKLHKVNFLVNRRQIKTLLHQHLEQTHFKQQHIPCMLLVFLQITADSYWSYWTSLPWPLRAQDVDRPCH